MKTITHMISILFNFAQSLSQTIIVVPPAVFIFTVTFLGTAVEKIRKEEKDTTEKEDASTKKEISKLEAKIKKAKRDGKTDDLLDNLDKLKKHKKETDEKIKKIKNKYSSISLVNVCIYPFSCLLIAAFLAQVGAEKLAEMPGSQLLNTLNIAFLLAILALYIFSFGKLYSALCLVQEMSSNKKENETFDRLKDTIKTALLEDRESSKSEVDIKFDKSFPLNVNTLTDFTIDFKISLQKGTVLNNVAVWFFVPDGLELIEPDEKSSWRQGADYNPPNIRTVKVFVGNMSVGPYNRQEMKIKTTATVGKYRIKYKIYGDGYVSIDKYLELAVV